MRTILKNRSTALIIIIILIVGLLAVVLSATRSTDLRSRAVAATTLNFSPASTPSTPLKAVIGTTLPLGVYITPNSNLVSYVLLEITYDPTYFDSTSAVFVLDAMSTLNLREGPIYESGKVTISFDIGNDVSKAVNSQTKIGTLSLKPIAKTPRKSTTLVRYGASTTILSLGSADSTQENVLAGTTPAYVVVSAPTKGNRPPR